MKDVYTIEDLRDWQTATADCTPSLKLAVIGDPVAHSKSPVMHNAALSALGIPTRYTRLHIQPSELKETLQLLPKAGFIGINCTIPHKVDVVSQISDLDESAQQAGGVNTIVVEPNGRLKGYSTDGAGFSRAVAEAFGAKLCSFRVLVIGAGGGAGRAVAMQCAAEGCPQVMLVNRTLDKLTNLVSEISSHFPAINVSAGSLELLPKKTGEADLIVNCTSLGMKADDSSPLPADLIQPRHFVYDTIYVGDATPLQQAASKAGARSANGLGMLLHQGARSFEHWFHKEPPLELMRSALLSK